MLWQNRCRTLAPWKESYDKPRQHIKKQRHHLADKGPSGQSCGFCSGHVWMWEVDHKEGWCLNCCFRIVVLERLLRVPWTARRSNQSILKEIILEYSWKDWYWSSNILATQWEELTHWKRPWCWERLKAGEEGSRGWDSWMASLTQWTWVWANSRRWWRTGKPGVLQSMGSQRLGHNLVIEQQHPRFPCPSPSPGVCSNSCPFSQCSNENESESCSVMSNSLQPHGYSPWNSLGQNTGVGNLSLLQGIFPTQRLNPGLPHSRCILY